jgi:hypothetical protein
MITDAPNSKSCFVCDPRPRDLSRESPGSWVSARRACREHCAAATLASGEKVDDFLRRDWPADQPPIEGNALNYLLNPVWVGEHRGWCEFVAGHRIVFEEVFPARNYWEFVAQHCTPEVDFTWAAHTRRDELTPEFGLLELAQTLLATDTTDGFLHCWQIWNRTRALEEEMGRRGISAARSATEVVDLFKATKGHVRSDLDLPLVRIMVGRLQELGETRFKHLAGQPVGS